MLSARRTPRVLTLLTVAACVSSTCTGYIAASEPTTALHRGRAVAIVRQAVPGVVQQFREFTRTTIHHDGHVGIYAEITNEINFADDEGFWREIDGELRLMVLEGTTVPNSQVPFSFNGPMSLAVLNDGNIAFTSREPPAVWSGGADGLTRSEIGLVHELSLVANPNGQVAFLGDGEDGRVVAVGPVDELNVFSGFSRIDGYPVISASGQAVFRALTADGAAIYSTTAGGELSRVPLPPGESDLRYHGINNAGQLYGQRRDRKILLGDVNGLEVFLAEGAPAPGAGGATYDFFGPSLFNSNGDFALNATLSDGQGEGVWAGRVDGEMVELLRKGQQAPGFPPGWTIFANEVGNLVPTLNAEGLVVIEAMAVSGLPGVEDRTAVFVFDIRGRLLDIVSTGDQVEFTPDSNVGPGRLFEIREINLHVAAEGSFPTGTNNEDGRASALSNSGDLLLDVYLERWGQSVIVFSDLGPKEPGDFDGDGDVDRQDLAVWQEHSGLVGSAYFRTGDSDFDRNVDGDDLLNFLLNFTGSASESATETATVPEPASWMVVCVFGMISLRKLRPAAVAGRGGRSTSMN